MDMLDFTDKFASVGNGPGYAGKLKAMGYTHVVSLQPSLSQSPTCQLGSGKECTYSLWCGFAFFKQEPDITHLEQSAADGVMLMERRTTFCDAVTRELIDGVQFCAAELTGTELSRWIDYFGAKPEDNLSMNDTPMWFYSAPARAPA